MVEGSSGQEADKKLTVKATSATNDQHFLTFSAVSSPLNFLYSKLQNNTVPYINSIS